MELKTPEGTKPAIWGGVVGAIAITIIGFSAGWVVTSGAAQNMAETKVSAAVENALAPLCVDRFQTQSADLRKEDLTALEDASSWEIGDYVVKQGWMKSLGTEANQEDIAEECGDQILQEFSA